MCMQRGPAPAVDLGSRIGDRFLGPKSGPAIQAALTGSRCQVPGSVAYLAAHFSGPPGGPHFGTARWAHYVITAAVPILKQAALSRLSPGRRPWLIPVLLNGKRFFAQMALLRRTTSHRRPTCAPDIFAAGACSTSRIRTESH